METNKILSADLLDLIFDNRNKDYGAYELRKTYSRRVTKALMLTGGIAALVFTGTVLARNVSPARENKMEIREMVLEQVKDEIKPVEPLKEKLPEPEPVKSQAYVTPRITPDEDVTDVPPDQDVLTDVKIDTKTVLEGAAEGPTEPDIKPGEGTGIVEDKKEPNNEPFTAVEVDAEFQGNWEKFLRRYLVPEVPVENSAPAGRYKVELRFVVDVDGKVSNIEALSNNGYGMEQEAIRVLKKSDKWKPAIQNGRQVKAYRRQVIIFEVYQE